jgi:hydrogenase nickel incorporation protein HypA/HybF
MHELSIVMNIIDIAQKESSKANAAIIDEIEIDIGDFSTVEMDAFDFAWQQAVKETILENAVKKINHIKGKVNLQILNSHRNKKWERLYLDTKYKIKLI